MNEPAPSYFDFVLGYLRTLLEAGDLLTLVAVPLIVLAALALVLLILLSFTSRFSSPPFVSEGGGGALIVVIAVIGILAAVAVPNYLQMKNRAQINAGDALLYDAYNRMLGFVMQEDRLPQGLGELGFAEPAGDANMTLSMDPDGSLRLVFSGEGELQGRTLLMRQVGDPNGGVAGAGWSCVTDIPAESLTDRLRSECEVVTQ